MEVSFYLKRTNSVEPTSIYARICFSGYKMKYYITESINPRFWNSSSQRAKETGKFKEYPEFNNRLDSLSSDIKSIYRTYLNDHQNSIPTPSTFKKLLDAEIKEKVEQSKDLLQLFQSIIDQSKNGTRLNPKSGHPINPNTIKTYVTTLNHLKEFEKIKRRKIDFESIDLDFYKDYTEYLIKGLKTRTNAAMKKIQVFKLIMNEATERGLNNNLSYKSKRFVTVREKSDNIYLTANEIMEIEKLDLASKPSLDRTRDLFLIGCYTGLRYSDYTIIDPKLIKNGMLEITQTKTNDNVVIPIHPSVRKICNKYGNILPTQISNQKTNEYLKEIGKLVESLKTSTSKTYTKAGMKLTQNFKKWEMLSTHTARRSFATNEFLAGTPTLTIMAITGHRTEKAFMKYIKVSNSEHAKLMQMHWEKRPILKLV